MEYLPFGETLVEEHLNSYNSPFKFNGKELDEETGNYYYGARYYNPKWSIWLSVDPLAEKYPGWSPYIYTLNNPINYTDPTGMSADDVIIKGEKAQQAFEQLKASTNLELDMVDGKVEIIGGKATSESDKMLKDAITDDKITVNINTTDGFLTEDGADFAGGAFRGSTINEDKTIDAYQLVNPEVLGKMDKYYERGYGTGMKHEVLEGFIGGEESPGSPAANTKLGKINYQNAHDMAKGLDLNYKKNTGAWSYSDRIFRPRGMSSLKTERTYFARKKGKSPIPLGVREFYNK